MIYSMKIIRIKQLHIYTLFIDGNLLMLLAMKKLFPDVEVPIPPSHSKLRKFRGGGAICADDNRCAEIGKSILERNGSVVDAAIATAICNGLGNMQNMGIGGGFFMTIYNKATGKAYNLNARDRAPLAAHTNMYKNKNGKASINGPLSIAVPGEMAGYWEAHQKFGKLPWVELFNDTIKLCRNGYSLHQIQYDDLFRTHSTKTDPTLRFRFFNESTQKFKPPGSLIKLGNLCDTLQIIANKGANELYNGSLGHMLINDLRKLGSILTINDIQNYTAKWQNTLETRFSDGSILYTSNFPSSGGLLIFILNVLNEFNFTRESFSENNITINTYHKIIETFKFAFALRSKMGDSDYVNMTEIAGNLTSKHYAKLIMTQIDDSKTWNDPKHYHGETHVLEDHGTSHISVISPSGDAVSLTSSLNTYFGSGIVSESTGILLNSAMDDFVIPSIVNYYGLSSSDKENLIQPGKRPLSSMAPSLLVDSDGNIKVVIGAAGGTKIITSIAYVIARILWIKDTVKEAVDAPRIHHQLLPMKLEYQYGIMKPIIEGLQKLGHITSRYRGRGSVVCALIQVNGTIYANADYRRAGDVSGINECTI
ncbi:glutathione hydrolase 1 proenzyme-like isoform X2 [Chelonus insularis]|uniref:glutathione hydrolase 1 proenzyme-like isoform X2 n=1 Tax=Chelonus insularis TaxID=460826 RepID=UPI001589E1D0|nr:glutathione hydrolase 1 proenzyme-like isoform X2 [Chelonus insularis]